MLSLKLYITPTASYGRSEAPVDVNIFRTQTL